MFERCLGLVNNRELVNGVFIIFRIVCSFIILFRNIDLGVKEIELFKIESVEFCEI